MLHQLLGDLLLRGVVVTLRVQLVLLLVDLILGAVVEEAVGFVALAALCLAVVFRGASFPTAELSEPLPFHRVHDLFRKGLRVTTHGPR